MADDDDLGREIDDRDDDDLDDQAYQTVVTVEILGLSLYTHHGVTAAEREIGQRLLIDLTLEVGEPDATLTDLIEDTVDYGEVCNVVALGRPVVVGTSRKSFLGKLTGRDVGERVAATVATNVLALERGARIFRVHDVAPTRDALAVAAATLRRWPTTTTSGASTGTTTT